MSDFEMTYTPPPASSRMTVNDAFQALVRHHEIVLEEHLVLDHQALKEALPHRRTALCLDFGFAPLKEGSVYAFGISYIAEDSPELEGHFPEARVLPGHWILEKMCLTCALVPGLVPSNLYRDDRVYLPLFRKTQEFSVEHSVLPKSIFVAQASLLPPGINDNWKRPAFSAKAFVDGVQCAEAIIMAKIDSSRRRAEISK